MYTTNDVFAHPIWRHVKTGSLYHVLGIDPTQQFLDRGGRPVSIVDDPAPIRELF